MGVKKLKTNGINYVNIVSFSDRIVGNAGRKDMYFAIAHEAFEYLNDLGYAQKTTDGCTFIFTDKDDQIAIVRIMVTLEYTED